MASFPTLSSGAEIRYPATRAIHYGVKTLRFADDTEKRWLDHDELNEWDLVLTNLRGYDVSLIRAFWISTKGAFDKTWDITITIDATPITFTSCRFTSDVFPAVENKEGRTTITLGVMQTIPQGATVVTSVVSDGLEVLYLFDDGSGETLADTSGNSRNATLGSTGGADSADPSWVSTGLEYADGDFCRVSSPPAGLISDAFTVCVAAKWTTGNVVPSVCWRTNQNFPIVGAGAQFNSQRPIIWMGSNIFAYFELSSPVDLTDDGWHFLIFSAPGRATTDVASFVLRADGQDQDVQSTGASGAEIAKSEFYLGDSVLTAIGATFDQAFMSMHSRVLSDAEKDQMRDYATEQLAGRVTLP